MATPLKRRVTEMNS